MLVKENPDKKKKKRFLKKKKKNQLRLMSREHKRVCTVLDYIGSFLILVSTITECISISAFAYLLGIPIGIMSSTTGLKNCVIAAGMKKYKSIIKKPKNKHNKTILLAKRKLDRVLISKANRFKY